MNTYQRQAVIVSLLLATLVAGGCKTPAPGESRFPAVAKLNSKMPWYDEDEPRLGVPTRIESNWVDTVLYKEGQKPQRGFGGRIHFYPENGEKPILVEGQVVVYAWDEANRNSTDNTPTFRYAFPSEQLPVRMSVSELGASYNFWLPWDEIGGPQTVVTLVTRFEPKAGPVVVSEQIRLRLPGNIPVEGLAGAAKQPKVPEGVPHRPATDPPFRLPGANATHAVRTASFENTAASVTPAATEPNRIAESMSITLPDSLRRQGGYTPPAQPNAAGVTQPAIQPYAPAGSQPAMLPSMPGAAAQPSTVIPGGVPTAPNGFSALPPGYSGGANGSNALNQSTLPAITPATAAAMRTGGYRLLPHQSIGQSLPTASLSGMVPTPRQPGLRQGTAGFPPPINVQTPAMQNAAPNGQQMAGPSSAQTLGSMQQFSAAGWNDHPIAPRVAQQQ
jgi:hypothetical protein